MRRQRGSPRLAGFTNRKFIHYLAAAGRVSSLPRACFLFPLDPFFFSLLAFLPFFFPYTFCSNSACGGLALVARPEWVGGRHWEWFGTSFHRDIPTCFSCCLSTTYLPVYLVLETKK